MLAVNTVLAVPHVTHLPPQLHVQLRHEFSAHHTHLIDKQPLPLQHALRRVEFALPKLVPGLAPPELRRHYSTAMVNGVTTDKRSCNGLQRDDLELYANGPAHYASEQFVPHSLKNM